MNVTFATGLFPPDIGGPATYVSHLATSLDERGVAANVVTYSDAPETPSPFPVVRVGRSAPLPWRYAAFFLAARRLGRNADLLFAQDPLSSGLPALLAARSLGIPLVVKIVGDIAWEIASETGATRDTVDRFQTGRYGGVVEWTRRAQRFVARSASRVIVPSGYLMRLVNRWNVAAERIQVVYNSLPESPEPAPSRRAARRRLGMGDESVVFSAGRLVPWKGFEMLMRLMPDIVHARPGARLFIAGSGPCETRLKQVASDLGMGDRITLTGRLDPDAMKAYLAAADLLVLASSYEGFSHLLLEAMRAELTVVASDVGGNPELVTDGESGILVPFDDPNRWKDVLIELLEDPHRRSQLASAGRRRSLDFGWESTVAATLDVLGGVAR